MTKTINDTTPSGSESSYNLRNLARCGVIVMIVLGQIIYDYFDVVLLLIPKELRIHQLITKVSPKYIGLSPAFNYGVESPYSLEKIYETCKLQGQNAIVTGANSGLGFEVSLALARCGASVTLACRNPIKCNNAKTKIQDDEQYNERLGRGELSTMIVDTSSLSSVRSSCKQYLKNHNGEALDMLYLNAGIAVTIPDWENESTEEILRTALSEDGIEKTYATNVVGHHLMYRILEPLISNAKAARIVLTSSVGSFDTFDYGVATNLDVLNGVSILDPKNLRKNYGQSKLAQILWAKELSRIMNEKVDKNGNQIFVNAMHPGAVDTPIFNQFKGASHIFPWYIRICVDWVRDNTMWSARDASLTLLHLGVETQELIQNKVTGKYFHPHVVEVTNPLSLNTTLQRHLWKFNDELVKDFL